MSRVYHPHEGDMDEFDAAENRCPEDDAVLELSVGSGWFYVSPNRGDRDWVLSGFPVTVDRHTAHIHHSPMIMRDRVAVEDQYHWHRGHDVKLYSNRWSTDQMFQRTHIVGNVQEGEIQAGPRG